MSTKPEIIYHDEEIIIVNKPADMLSIQDRQDSTKPSMVGWLNAKFGKVFILHRLDRETSGIMCFAKNAESHRNLSMQFEHKVVQKFYQVIVLGVMKENEGIIENAIGEHPTIPGKMIISKKGKEAITIYKPLERFKNYTLVEAEIKTGRTHQIRVHMQSIGYPLAVDKVYSTKQAFYLSDAKTKKFRLGKLEEEKPMMDRNTLHSYKIILNHPTTNESMTFTAEPPKDFRAMLTQIKKWDV
jgi:23S rRNA pseudouridine1911/1915/1917 synthase